MSDQQTDPAGEEMVDRVEEQNKQAEGFGAGIARRNRSVEFFLKAIGDPADVSEINMAFHAGSYWSRTTEKVQLLNHFLKASIPLRILINTEETAGDIVSHMRLPMKRYVPLEDNLMEWAQLASIYPDQIMVRAARRPMLHRIYLIRNKDGSGSVSVKNYMYGDASSDEERWIAFSDPQKSFGQYRDEFDYIWNHLSDPISEECIAEW